MTAAEMSAWVLIIVIRGTTPPTGVVVQGFATEEACRAEESLYDCSKGRGGKYICKCEPGRVQ